ncbi:MAG: hypothetical protein H8E64_08475 [Candidatus Marinimicrobia bacterium]|nr:hypothetical protein [Candidatus Neomarinimicrobiota bacterium]
MKKLTILLMLILSVSLISAQGKTCCKKGGFEKGKCQKTAVVNAEDQNSTKANKADCPHEGKKCENPDGCKKADCPHKGEKCDKPGECSKMKKCNQSVECNHKEKSSRWMFWK